MKYKVTTPPGSPAVSLAEAKVFMRVDGDADNDTITRAIAAATAWCQLHARRSFGTQTITAYADDWPEDGVLRLPMPPLVSVTSVKYIDTAGIEQAVAAEDYQVDKVDQPGRVLPAPGKSWPAVQSGRVNAIVVEYVAGEASIDPRATQAILLLASHWFTNREAIATGTISKELELALQALLTQLWHGWLA